MDGGKTDHQPRPSNFVPVDRQCCSQQGHSVRNRPGTFRNWSDLLNPDLEHRWHVKRIWRTWQERLFAYHANKWKSIKRRSRRNRGPVPTTPAGSVQVPQLYSGVRPAPAPARAPAPGPARLQPARSVPPPTPPPPPSANAAVGPQSQPFIEPLVSHQYRERFQPTPYPYCQHPGPYGSWPLPSPMFHGPQSDHFIVQVPGLRLCQ